MSAKPPPSQPPSSTTLHNRRHHHPLNSTTNLHWSYHPPSPAKIFTSTATNSTNTSITTSTTTSTQNYDNTLLNLLRQRKTEDAWIAYTQSPHLPNPTCLSRLICQLSYQNTSSALTRAQSIIQRLRRERQLHRLDSNSLGLLAVAAAKSGDTLYANSILKSMLRSGYLPHVKAWSAVVSRLTSSGDDGPKEAVKLFSQVTRTIRRFGDPTLVINSRPDTAAYNAVLNACANLGWTEKFLQLFEEMPDNKCEPDVLTYNIMIKLCACCDRKDLLVFVLERILEKEIPLCMTTLQSLVASYIDFDDLETAEKIVQAMRDGRKDLCKMLRESNLEEFKGNDDVFEKLLPNVKYSSDYEPPLLREVYKPNTRMYTTLMKGYMKAGRIKDTVRMLEAMRNQEDSNSRPDHVSYTTVVSALVNVGSMEKARQVLIEMSRAGIQANRVTYNILLKGYCQQLQIDNARETIKEMIDVGIEPDAVSYNTLIDGCILIDDCAGALVFFNEMRARGIAPTKISYTTLMKAFSVSGQPKLAHDVFNEMENDPRVKVDLVAWNMLIEAYSRLGMLDFAKETVENMKKKGIYPDVATYGSLANCIALARKPGEALLLWNEIKERCGLITDETTISKSVSNVPVLKPDEGLLDTLADICVRAAFFKKALEIVAFMEELGIAPNKIKYTRIYVEMHSRMFTSKHASRARQDRRIERKRAAEAFKFWLGLPNSYYGSEWRLEGEGGDEDEYAI